MTTEQLIAAEKTIRFHWESGNINALTHLSGGNEEQLIEVFRQVKTGDWLFVSHRAHYHWLLSGGTLSELLDKVLAGRSMFLYSKERKFISSAIVAGNCAIAAGVAHSIKIAGGSERVWCFMGDGAEDEGHFYEAVRWSNHHDLPITFVIEDNDSSCGVPTKERMGRSFTAPHGRQVYRYSYKPTFPHAGSGCAHKITFKA